MIIRWLQLSDLHCNYKNFQTDFLRENLIKKLEKLNIKADFLLLTGDFFYQAKKEGKEAIVEFINDIRNTCSVEKEEVFMAPGNHDIPRDVDRTDDINAFFEERKKQKRKGETLKELSSNKYRHLFNENFTLFFELYEEIRGEQYGDEPHIVIERDNYRIFVINTCTLSCCDQDEGRLSVLDSTKFIPMGRQLKNDQRLNIAIMHHGIDFLDPEERIKLENWMEDSYIDIVFAGHSHNIGYQDYQNTNRKIMQLTCGAPIQDKFAQPSFYYCEYDTETGQLKSKIYLYSNQISDWHLGTGVIRAFEEGVLSSEIKRVQSHVKKKCVVKKNYGNKKNLVSTHIGWDDVQSLRNFGILSALPYFKFMEIRKQLISEAKGEIILAGQSLRDALNTIKDTKSIVSILEEKFQRKEINNLTIFLTDPLVFDSSPVVLKDKAGNPVDTPISKISSSMKTIFDKLGSCLKEGQTIHVFFIPLIQLDHMVFVNDFLLLRHTLLWTNDEDYKATPVLCKDISDECSDEEIQEISMYYVYRQYIERLKRDSMTINTEQKTEIELNATLAQKAHFTWRNEIAEKYMGKIVLHKLYRTQLISDLHSTWDTRFRSFSKQIHWQYNSEDSHFYPNKNGKGILRKKDLFDEKTSNLLKDDKTQKLLLPYIKETEKLLKAVIQKYDSTGTAEVFPSLDIGMPNNIERLAGGFATGMLVVWKCGTPLIPIDTTVNVCSSSLYEINSEDLQKLGITEFFNNKKIYEVIKAGSDKGISFSFDSGNHFLMLTKEREKNKFYLVMHSSARQFKDSYFGLYPQENNWYNSYIKRYEDEKTGRYIRYLKDKEAERFISFAKLLNQQNEDIHDWIANKLCSNLRMEKVRTYHHYGMPTDYSVAIGTYVIDSKDTVPIFTREGYPIYCFQPSENMWGIELEGKKKHIVPHGWGQALNFAKWGIENTKIESLTLNTINNELVLMKKEGEERRVITTFPVGQGKKMVTNDDIFVRHLFSEYNTIEQPLDKITSKDIKTTWNNYMVGTITRILDPIATYSANTKGVLNYYSESQKEKALFY